MKATLQLSDDVISSKIHIIRGMKVMLDRDLAALYGVETKMLKRSVKRNLRRFPSDFMFQLTNQEFATLRYQFGTSKTTDENRGGDRYSPFAFTEQGIAMLSSILTSGTAIDVNIRIIRVFTRMRELLQSHDELLKRMEKLETEMKLSHGIHAKHEEEIQNIFSVLRQLLQRPSADEVREKRIRVGFKK